jgi:hypothetical protein
LASRRLHRTFFKVSQAATARNPVTRRRICGSIRQTSISSEEYISEYRSLADTWLSSSSAVLGDFGTESVQASVSQLMMWQYMRCSGRPGGYREDALKRTFALSYQCDTSYSNKRRDRMSAIKIAQICTRVLRFICRATWAVSEENHSESH